MCGNIPLDKPDFSSSKSYKGSNFAVKSCSIYFRILLNNESFSLRYEMSRNSEAKRN